MCQQTEICLVRCAKRTVKMMKANRHIQMRPIRMWHLDYYMNDVKIEARVTVGR